MKRRPPLFLARADYRRRRKRDAARILPVVGAVAMILPLMWGGGLALRGGTATLGIYLFGVWLVMIAAAAALAPALIRVARDEPGGGDAGGGHPGGGDAL